MCVLVFMLIFTSITFAYNNSNNGSSNKSGKSKKEQLNEEFRNIAEEMRDAYENGDLNKIIDLYTKKCCKGYGKAGEGKAKAGVENKRFKKVTREIRASIYQWVLLSYTALDRPDLGDIFLKKLLILRRTQGTSDYWLSIRNAANNKYYVAPRLLVGLSIGLNLTMAYPTERYSFLEFVSDKNVDPYAKVYPLDFKRSRDMHVGVSVEYALTKHLWLCTQPSLTKLKFQYHYTLNYGEKPIFTFRPLHRVQCFEIPLLLKYHFAPGAGLKPYIQVGGFFRFVTSARKDIYIKQIEADGTDIPEYLADENLAIKSLLSRTQKGLWLGAGVGYGTKGGIKLEVNLEINYKHGFNNIVNADMRWSDAKLLYFHYDVFDNIKLSHLEVGLKISVPILFKAFKK